MIPREARIVLGIFCLSAATFLWFNFFNRPGLEAFAAMAQEVPAPLPLQEEVVAPTEEPLPETVTLSLTTTPAGATVTLDGEPLPVVTPFEELEVDAAEERSLRVTLNGYAPYEGPLNLSFNRNISVYLEPQPEGVVAVAPGEVAPSEVAPSESASDELAPEGGTLVAREVLVNELPFLVTAPPETAPEGEAEEEALTRPQGQQRASVNPFSPIIVRQQAEANAPQARNVPVVSAPTAAPTGAAPAPVARGTTATAPVRPAVEAPAPRALTPPSTQATLPRAIPGGTLPVAPEILRRTQSAPETPTLALAEVAAIRVPSAPDTPLTVPSDSTAPTESALPEPLTFARAGAIAGGAPLAAGADGLSRYLRDNGVTFTGAALGPVSVGIFRIEGVSVPVTVPLGGTLPETDIVLTELSGQEATLSRDTNAFTLILDSRR